MDVFRHRKLAWLIGGFCLCALLLTLLRARFIDAASSEISRLGFSLFHVAGTRVPCVDVFDIGVEVVYYKSPNGQAFFARLCRPPDWWSDWTWHPR